MRPTVNEGREGKQAEKLDEFFAMSTLGEVRFQPCGCSLQTVSLGQPHLKSFENKLEVQQRIQGWTAFSQDLKELRCSMF